MKHIFLTYLTCYSLVAFSQQNARHDTIKFDGYQGIIFDTTHVPFESHKIIPISRFKPSEVDVRTFEQLFIDQYDDAIEKHHKLFYEEYLAEHRWGYTDKDWKGIEAYRDNGQKMALKAQRRLRKDYDQYDREYYGYVAGDGTRYLRIQFQPQKERWTIIGGERQLDNYPPLELNLDTETLSLAGWTGDVDY